MADKESGVYITITDNSFETPGVSSMVPLVTALTTKGELGLNLVNANNFKNILGYDLKYNSNYLGLNEILQNVSYAYVWRLNQNAKLANAYFTSVDSEKSSSEDAETFEDVTMLEPKPIMAIALKDVGNPQTTAIKFTPIANETTVANEFATPSTSQDIKFDDVSQNEMSTYDDTSIKGGCIIYNAANNAIVGIIKPNYDGRLSVYKVVDGNIVDDVMTTVTTNTWSDGTNFYGSDMQVMEEPGGDASEPLSLGVVRQSTYDVEHPTWTLNNKFYDEEYNETEEPEGSPNPAVSLGEALIAPETSEYIVAGRMYITNDVGTSFYTVTTLGTTFEDTVKVPVSDSDALTELGNLYSTDSFKEISYLVYTETKQTGFYKKNQDSWFKVVSFSTKSIVINSIAETETAIITALESAADIQINFLVYSKEVLTQDNTCGTADWSETELSITLTKTLSKDSFWTVRIIPTVITEWKMSVSKYEENQYTIMNEYSFSTDSESTMYWKNIDFGDIQFYLESSIASNWSVVRDYFTLDNGSNGDENIIASDIDLTVLEKSKCNVLAMNGITNYKVINKLAQKGESLKKKIHVFGDAPAFASYVDLENWMKNVYRSQYLAIGARPDQVEIAEGEYVYVYPSVNYIKILSRMQNQFQSLMYPPAGFTYGTISAENLIECDYDNYGNELKTNRINWQRSKNRGTVMWEQRTTYSLSTDLSYIAPNFIVDGVCEQLYDFEDQFNFRYTSPTDLLNQESGIKGILDDYVTKGFVYKYELKVPTYAEAQAAGRELVIEIGIAIGKDSEIIRININLNNG